ncbi:ADP-ribose glycohydrolase MACROD2 isoform X3 [Homo sapiens]|uniref:ADP-ribose glycohydrolase MACROD2 isoform X3 n=1 Tax=Homo sapiens TaxID=9606 RepID=UPI0007DC7EBA|nr:ADP-ribose glycohydrolase MACROD2 isoform X3 [Homo sapiens]XP_054178996.1 ADP-ribose glycohydrolase MACROD2 isoform X3 [Homo sapiens]|eukprot:XP_016883165.1 O-acetyl-ADP-ribose deacetylase MACROD2 isoform X3 [Homo sapiens]
MNEFFSVDDNNEEEEDVEMKEDSESNDFGGQEAVGGYLNRGSSQFLHYKGNHSAMSSDENGPEEKQSVEEMEEQSQDADGVNTVTVPGPASEEAVEDCKDEDFAKDENITKGGEVTDHSVRDQDHPDGQENDSTKNEIKIETESQSSYMETEELSSNQEDAVIVEQPEVIPLTEDQEEKEGEKAPGEDTPRMPGKSEGSSDLENTPGPDAGAQDEAKEQRNGTK